MIRAITTAYHIANGTGASQVDVKYELTEMLQSWCVEGGLYTIEIQSQFEADLRKIYLENDKKVALAHNAKDPLIEVYSDKLIGGECYEDYVVRTHQFLDELISSDWSEHDIIICVGHNFTVEAVTERYCSPREYADYCSVTSL